MDERTPISTGERPLAMDPMAPTANVTGSESASTPGTPLADPRALTILTTEHWSLLSARALVYNEAFARGGTFLSLLSASLVALGLVATATGFSDAFLILATVVLAVNLFVGFASLGRIVAASHEDIRYLQAMNRIRHAYHEMVPGLERYFLSGHHDDMRSVLAMYAPIVSGPARLLHGLTTTPGMLSMICAVLTGALVAIIGLLATRDAVPAGLAGVVASIVVFLALAAILGRRALSRTRAMPPMFAREDEPS